MLLAREFVSYLSRQLVKRLTPGIIETPSPDFVAEKVAEVITDELAVEDRLNDEVRDLLSQYSDYMRRESVSYQEMFRRIKNTLISQRKVIRASGRDTGDAMKLSRDKAWSPENPRFVISTAEKGFSVTVAITSTRWPTMPASRK